MTTIIKDKNRLVVPACVQRRAGIKTGDALEFRVSGSVIAITPKLPPADDEYTPEQRRIIGSQIAEGLEDIKEGRVSRRFLTVDEMLASLKAAKSSRRQKTRP